MSKEPVTLPAEPNPDTIPNIPHPTLGHLDSRSADAIAKLAAHSHNSPPNPGSGWPERTNDKLFDPVQVPHRPDGKAAFILPEFPPEDDDK